MSEELRLMCMLAHPDDETLGMGGPLARYAAEGVGTYVVTATRGEHGWPDAAQPYPGPVELGRMREAELHDAAAVLGIREVQLLDYEDGQLAMADPAPAVASLVAHVRRVRPQVVTTFAPDGAYGHPDHIAISQLALTATYC
ncbi:MAG TPA: PIG-L family deacetylase, partial [Chloroflexia bacterium]|nr:PIG-L family deacetylase [Chloroflexia bacterium]